MSCGFVLLLQEASGLLWSTGVGDGLNLRKMWHVRYLFTTLVHLQFSSSIRDGLEMTTLCFTMSRSETHEISLPTPCPSRISYSLRSLLKEQRMKTIRGILICKTKKGRVVDCSWHPKCFKWSVATLRSKRYYIRKLGAVDVKEQEQINCRCCRLIMDNSLLGTATLRKDRIICTYGNSTSGFGIS